MSKAKIDIKSKLEDKSYGMGGVQQADRFWFHHNLFSELKIFTVSMVTKELLQIFKNSLLIA